MDEKVDKPSTVSAEERRAWRDAIVKDVYGFATPWDKVDGESRVELATLPATKVVVVQGSGAHAHIYGDVGADAIVVAAGAEAKITVHGRVEQGAYLYASGGSAQIVVHGTVEAHAKVIARGGGVRVRVGLAQAGSTVEACGGGAVTDIVSTGFNL